MACISADSQGAAFSMTCPGRRSQPAPTRSPVLARARLRSPIRRQDHRPLVRPPEGTRRNIGRLPIKPSDFQQAVSEFLNVEIVGASSAPDVPRSIIRRGSQVPGRNKRQADFIRGIQPGIRVMGIAGICVADCSNRIKQQFPGSLLSISGSGTDAEPGLKPLVRWPDGPLNEFPLIRVLDFVEFD